MDKQDTKKYAGMTVLVVDNDKSLVAARVSLLEDLGFTVVSAATEAAAEKLLRERNFDLAITEVMLEFPDSGFIFCYKMKKAQPECKILIMSNVTGKTGFSFNLSSPETREWVKADAFIGKNIYPEQLKAAIAKLLD